MSGHSKWHKIRHAKETTDKKKGQTFGKFANEIAAAARRERDPDKNPTLRDIIVRAKKANMPQANIDRLLQGKEGQTMTETIYEGFGPAGSSLYIITLTDNSKRTVAELRTALKNNGGQLGDIGSVRWKFMPCATATLELPKKIDIDELELALLDIGALDMNRQNNTLTVSVPLENKAALESITKTHNVATEHIQYDHVPTQPLPLTKDALTELHNLIEVVKQNPDVEHVYTDAVPA